MKFWQKLFGTPEGTKVPPEHNNTSEQFDSACFVCEGPRPRPEEKPYLWLKPRLACSKHSASKVLDNGELVSDFLQRRKTDDYPLEGSGLNYMINPVRIEGVRGWIDFGGGGCAVIEEVFPSRDYFEFYAQHSLKALDGFYALYEKSGSLSTGMSVNKLRSVLDTPAKQWCLTYMLGVFNSMRGIQEALAARGKAMVESPDEAEELFTTSNLNKDYSLELVPLLLELGRVRFGHLRIEA